MKKYKCIRNDMWEHSLKIGQIYDLKVTDTGMWGRISGIDYDFIMTRFEEVIEPDFKVGDKVVFAREDTGDFKVWNSLFKIGDTYTVEGTRDTGNIRADNGYIMPTKCFDLAPEPKPEPKTRFKVGDKVKIKDNPPARGWSSEKMNYLKGKTEEILWKYDVDSYRLSSGFIISDDDIECLAPEPTPQFKIGDWVKVAKEVLLSDIQHFGKTAKVIKVTRIGDKYLCKLDGVSLLMYDSQLELAEEPKPEVKERATVKKVRCIDALFSQGRLKSNQIYEVTEGVTPFGTKYYTAKGVEGTFLQNRFEDVVEEKYPQIVKFNTFKVIFNPPYTIVEMPIMFSDRKYTGKAKCNPEDTYDKWIGYKLAYERMMESKPCSK